MALPMDRAAAFQLLRQHTETESLIKHAISVEAAMRHFAELYGEDVEYWGTTWTMKNTLRSTASTPRFICGRPALMRASSMRCSPMAMGSAPMSSRKSRWKR